MIVIIIAIILVIMLILGFVAPKEYKVSREILIDAPSNIVFNHISSLRRMYAWHPMAEKDSVAIFEFKGMEGTVGSQMEWRGNSMIGTGIREIRNIEVQTRVATVMRYSAPWESRIDDEFILLEEDGQCLVRWSLIGTHPFPFNIRMLFLDLGEKADPEISFGLEKLKSLSESEYLEKYRGYELEEVDYRSTTYIVLEDSLSVENYHDFFGWAFDSLRKQLTEFEIEVSGAPCGLFYEWNEDGGWIKLAAGFPVAPGLDRDSVQTLSLPRSKALLINYYGTKQGSEEAHIAMEAYLADNELRAVAPVIEEYVTDPYIEPDTSKWLVRVIYKIE